MPFAGFLGNEGQVRQINTNNYIHLTLPPEMYPLLQSHSSPFFIFNRCPANDDIGRISPGGDLNLVVRAVP